MPPDRWLELTVRPPGEPDLVSSILLELGGSGVQELDGALITYMPPPPDPDAFVELVGRRLRAHFPVGEVILSWRWQPQKDWERLWRQGLGTRRITSRLIVSPSWEVFEPKEGDVLLTLDPGMAFGTAEHATTRGCLRALDSLIEPGSRIADVGAGSGILSIAAARLGAARILAFEMDEMSCETALENVENNGVGDRVEIRKARVVGGEPLPAFPYDGIVANLQSHLLLPLLSSFRESLGPGGWLVLSGILVEERGAMISSASVASFLLRHEDEEDGWWTGVFYLTPSGP